MTVGISESTGTQKKNIVLLAIDDLIDYKRFSSYFGIDLEMPNLERIAARGVTFAANSAVSPQCNPSRTAVLTGESALSTSVYQNRSLIATDIATNDEFLQLHFAGAGYQTALAGKIFHGWYERVMEDFDQAVEIPDLFAKRPVKKQILPDFKISEFGVEYLSQANPDQPFFLSLGFHKPHKPWLAPEKYFDLFDIKDISDDAFDPDDLDDVPQFFIDFVQFTAGLDDAVGGRDWKQNIVRYAAVSRFVDDMIGRVVDEIDRGNLWDNTTVVLFSDHGFHLGDKGVSGKYSLYEISLSSPLIIVDPGIGAPGSVTQQPTSLLDIWPTLAELTGVAVPNRIEGTSLVPLMVEPEGNLGRIGVVSTIGCGLSLRTEEHRYILYNDGSEELFSIGLDPLNQVNLAMKEEFDDLTDFLGMALRQEARKFDFRIVESGESVIGGAGGETFFVLPGGSVSGGAGDDVYFVTHGSEFSESDGGGFDTAFISFLGTYLIPDEIERVELSMHAPTEVVGNDRSNEILGSWHRDKIFGMAGDDFIDGKQGGDRIWGGDGDDRLFGYWDNDRIFGNAGNDKIDGDTGSDILEGGKGEDDISGGPGDDTLSGGQGSDTLGGGGGQDTLEGDDGDDFLLGGFGDDVLLGGRDDDNLRGGPGSDKLVGSEGDDILEGGVDEDRLFGGIGSDFLNGGADADRISGGLGDDILIGGPGTDIFMFRGDVDNGFDVIRDFQNGLDKMKLRGGFDFADLEIVREGVDRIVSWDLGHITMLDVRGSIGPEDFDFV